MSYSICDISNKRDINNHKDIFKDEETAVHILYIFLSKKSVIFHLCCYSIIVITKTHKTCTCSIILKITQYHNSPFLWSQQINISVVLILLFWEIGFLDFLAQVRLQWALLWMLLDLYHHETRVIIHSCDYEA